MSTDPRIPLLSLEESAKIAEQAKVLPQMAELSVFRVLLRQPVVGKAVQDLLLALLFRGELDARLRELVIMRLGWATASCYEWTQHWRVATELGLPEADLLAVRDWRGSDRFDAADRAVLAATDETLESGSLSAETWAECEARLGSPQACIELVAAIGTWRMISSILRSLQIPLEDGVEAWPPDGRTPDA